MAFSQVSMTLHNVSWVLVWNYPFLELERMIVAEVLLLYSSCLSPHTANINEFPPCSNPAAAFILKSAFPVWISHLHEPNSCSIKCTGIHIMNFHHSLAGLGKKNKTINIPTFLSAYRFSVSFVDNV